MSGGLARRTLLRHALRCAAIVLPCACALAGQAGSPQPAPPLEIALDQNVDLVEGQTARLEASALVITLLDAHGPRAGCHDCPVGATITVRSPESTRELKFSFGGLMLPALLEKARRKPAFDLVFVAVKVSDAGLTLRVERPKPDQ